MLREAAAESSIAFMQSIENSYDIDSQYVPSLKFEEQMKKLFRRAKHPYLYRSLQRIASIILAVLITGSAWLAVDTQARAAFFGWVHEVYETFFVYRFSGDADESVDPIPCYPSWLPEGYSELYTKDMEGVVHTIFSDTSGQYLKIQYTSNLQDRDWFFDATDMTKHQTIINGCHADLFISNSKERANAVIWITNDNTAFYVSAFLEESDLIKVAENVMQK